MMEQGVPSSSEMDQIFPAEQDSQGELKRTLSRKIQMKQGLLQGAVLSPLLFLFYINNLVDEKERQKKRFR